MRLRLLCAGQKMPGWVSEGMDSYCKRMPREMPVELTEIPLGKRSGRNPDIARAVSAESRQMLAAVRPDDRVIALEVNGQSWSTERLADHMKDWQMQGSDVVFLVGGPDGLSGECRQRAEVHWSLSPLTLPHPLVRILLAEQLYRAWSLNNNHPYHRAG
ncbi:MAG: 23S rRNA (pseudouridine(1915)-N(3))-methyltransferase RlmH [Oleiphilaceae bacterium]|nr:23S rRNA (pseudouridine(1915)-N(3))-methyltransferase RlmH [Oleiphilaceae bacterium]